MKIWLYLCLAVLALGGLLPGDCRAARTEELTIAAAVPLKPALREILPLFEQRYPEVEVRVVYGFSHQLREQIEAGAPVDVFLPAVFDDAERLHAKGLTINGRPMLYAQTSLVLVTSASSHIAAASFRNMNVGTIFRLAVADPQTTALGDATQALLSTLRLTRSHPHIRYLYGLPDEVVKMVSEGEADAGIVFRSDATGNPKLRIMDRASADIGPPVLFGEAMVWTCRRASVIWAQRFAEFLQQEPVQDIFWRHGYDRVSSESYQARP
ncbi:MAG: molybdate ABC transporter substrate-binding protein [Nitrospira sp.]|jgi:molybdate transport system substrate-binding protein|nr:molybdate ABC transporter substrate-binding protein [Nitrospira sp.]